MGTCFLFKQKICWSKLKTVQSLGRLTPLKDTFFRLRVISYLDEEQALLFRDSAEPDSQDIAGKKQKKATGQETVFALQGWAPTSCKWSYGAPISRVTSPITHLFSAISKGCFTPFIRLGSGATWLRSNSFVRTPVEPFITAKEVIVHPNHFVTLWLDAYGW